VGLCSGRLERALAKEGKRGRESGAGRWKRVGEKGLQVVSLQSRFRSRYETTSILLTAVLKSLSSAYPSSTQVTTSSTSSPTFRLLPFLHTPPKQLFIHQALSLVIDSPHRGLSSQTLLALEAYISLASPSRANIDLEPFAKRCPESPLMSKSFIQTLTLLVPALPPSTSDRLSPTILSDLLEGFLYRHLSQARGKLVSQLILSSLRSSPIDTSKLLLRSLLVYDDTSRFNISAFTFRHVAE
jgi:hypothetical protein